MDRLSSIFWGLMMILVTLNAIHIVLTGKWTWFGLDRAALRLFQGIGIGLGRLITAIITQLLTWLRDMLEAFFRGLWQYVLRPLFRWLGWILTTGLTRLWQNALRPGVRLLWRRLVRPAVIWSWRRIALPLLSWLVQQGRAGWRWLKPHLSQAWQWLVQHPQMVLIALILFLLLFVGP